MTGPFPLRHATAIGTLALLLVGSSGASTLQLGPPGGRGQVTAESLVQVEAVVLPTEPADPGAFELAVVFRIAPGWHIYWSNPGEGGFATSVAVSSPPGVPASEVLFPAPKRFGATGELSYGYEGETVLFVPLRADSTARGSDAAGGVDVEATARWLVCKDICLAGSATTKAKAATSASPETIELIRKARTLLPRPIADWAGSTVRLKPNRLEIEGLAQGATAVEFFPADTPGVVYDQPQIAIADDRVRIDLPIRLEPDNALGKPMRVSGVLVIKRPQGVSVFEFAVPAASP